MYNYVEVYIFKYYLKATSYINDAIIDKKNFNKLNIMVPYVDNCSMP